MCGEAGRNMHKQMSKQHNEHCTVFPWQKQPVSDHTALLGTWIQAGVRGDPQGPQKLI